MLEMFETEFMQRAWLAGLIVAVICPLIGSFLVLRRQSMIGDGLGHIAFAGVAGGALMGWQPVLSAAAVTVLGALVIEWVRHQAGGLFRDDFSNFLLQWYRAGSCFYKYEPYGRF